MSQYALFNAKAPVIMDRLMADFPGLDEFDTAAIVGNLGHECNGFRTLQETTPVVKGSRGGWGWAQWTGPRRRTFESYVKRHRLDPRSDHANYAFLFLELKTTEKKAIPATMGANPLANKVIAFEVAFLRAGVKHYTSRHRWAQMALAAWKASRNIVVPVPTPAPRPVEEEVPVDTYVEPIAPPPPPMSPPRDDVVVPPSLDKPLTESKTIWSAVVQWLSTNGALALGYLAGVDWKIVGIIAVAATVAALVIYRERAKKRDEAEEVRSIVKSMGIGSDMVAYADEYGRVTGEATR